MALKPHFAALIYEGKRKFEYRRVKVKISEGDVLVVYESQPVSRITGCFVAGEVTHGDPRTLTGYARNSSAREYLEGAGCSSAIRIVDAKRFRTPILLTDLDPNLRAP